MMKKMFHILLLFSFLTLSCGKQAYSETPRDWDGTSTWFESAEPYLFSTYYKPYVGYVADPMPFYDAAAGDFKVLYLQDYRPNPVATYHPIWGVSTSDAAQYTSLGELISCGAKDDQDAALGTGCVAYSAADKLYYVYYTGHKYELNPGDSREMVMRATSPDFKNWTKDRTFFLMGSTDGYSRDDFRDPCIFADDDGLWHMIVTTRTDGGRNVLAEYTSSDLRGWTHKGVFLYTAWNRFYECPDVFKMGDWWYLVYSDMVDVARMVKYFKGTSLDNLRAQVSEGGDPVWPDDKEGILDSRLFYAAKTASDGTERFLWGWCPLRGGNDNATYQDWAGNLVAHRVVQRADGTLRLAPVPAIAGKFSNPETVKVMDSAGNVSGPGIPAAAGGTQVPATSSWTLEGAGHILFNRLPACSRIRMQVTCAEAFSVSLGRGSDSDIYYSLVVNPEEGNTKRKINFEENGEGGRGFIGGSDSFMFAKPDDDVYEMDLYIDNSVCVLYINDVLAYTNRFYGIRRNCWSVNALGTGTCTVTGLSVNSQK